jgi:hypothetical protein
VCREFDTTQLKKRKEKERKKKPKHKLIIAQ